MRPLVIPAAAVRNTYNHHFWPSRDQVIAEYGRFLPTGVFSVYHSYETVWDQFSEKQLLVRRTEFQPSYETRALTALTTVAVYDERLVPGAQPRSISPEPYSDPHWQPQERRADQGSAIEGTHRV